MGEKLCNFDVVVFQVGNFETVGEVIFGLDNFFDKGLSFQIIGVGFAGEDDLNGANITDLAETVGIGENKVGAFVAGDAAGKADSKIIIVHTGVGDLVGEINQGFFIFFVGLENFVISCLSQIGELLRLKPPIWSVLVKYFGKRRGNPGARVGAIGDVFDVK